MELAGVDLNLLVAFDALMEERSVSRAASRLSLSQPGISNALARLRKLFGDPLLVREGLALVPTSRADELRQPVRDALAIIRGALDSPAGFDPAKDRASCTVSCSDYSLLMLIGPLVRRLAATAPGGTIRVLPRLPDPARLLRDGAADLVIGPPRSCPRRSSPASGCSPTGGCAASGRQRGRGSADNHGRLPAPWPPRLLDRTRPARLHCRPAPRALPDTAPIEFTVESFLLAPFLLEGTDLVTVVPERAVPQLRRTPTSGCLNRPSPCRDHPDAVVAPRHTASPAHAWVRARIAEIAAELDQPEAVR